MFPMLLPGFTSWMTVHTRSTVPDYLFFPMLGPFEVSGLVSARASLAVFGMSGSAMELKVGWQLSDDRFTWPTSSTIDGTFSLAGRTSEGISFGTGSFDDLTGLGKGFMMPGVRTKNTGGGGNPTVPEFALAAIRIEFRKQ